jgi:mono/diheme cytochrome c family protein
MRRLIFQLMVVSLSGCGDDAVATRYLDDAQFRRQTLVASLVNPQNGYSRLRLAHYATGSDGDWDQLPAWNPPVATLDADGNPRDDEAALDLAAARAPATRRASGERAFYRYPVQLHAATPSATLVLARLADGSRATALTCASCHTRNVAGAIVPGLANEAIDLGWGPGRIDVAPPPGEEPVAIADLRPVVLEANLQRDGAVRNEGLATLAVRIETLIITSHGAVVRPPREVPLAIADWLASLVPPVRASDGRGAALFTARCARCHVPPTFAGPPVALAVVGTDPRVGQSADRGTGGYRVPSLRGVATRGRLLHDASVPDVATLLNPGRSVPGHTFSFDLAAEDRAALIAYVESL